MEASSHWFKQQRNFPEICWGGWFVERTGTLGEPGVTAGEGPGHPLEKQSWSHKPGPWGG